MRVCDAALLWTGEGVDHGFGERARTHAGIAMRAGRRRLAGARPAAGAAGARPDRARQRRAGQPARRGRGRARRPGDRRDVAAQPGPRPDRHRRARPARPPSGAAVREEPLQTGVLTEEALFAFNWQLALHGDPLTPEEMDDLAARRLADPPAARPVGGRRPRPRPQGPQAADPHRHPGPGGGRGALGGGRGRRGGRRGSGRGHRRRQPAPGARAAGVGRRPASRSSRRRRCAATLRDYQRHGLTWLDQLTSLGLGACLADDMGLGKTVTLIALALHRAAREGGSGPTLVVCPASLLGNWQAEVERFAPGVPVRRFHGSRRDLVRPRRGRQRRFVLTTYGTMRRDHEALAEVGWDLVVADEAQHVKNARSATARTLRRDPERGPGRPHRHPRRERPHRALVDPRLGDPGAARQPQRVPAGLGGADRVGRRPGGDRAVPRAGLAVPAAPPQVRPRHRPRAAAAHRHRPPAGADPRAGRALRGVRARLPGADRAVRRGAAPRPGAGDAHRPQADLQPPLPLPQAGGAAPVLGEDRPARRDRRHRAGRGRRRPRLHPVRRDGAAARRPPDAAGGAPPAAPRRDARWPSGSGWCRPSRPVPRPAACPSSCCRSRPAAPASTSPAPTTSSTSTAGGTPRSRSRPATAPTGSARPGRCRSTG